MTLNLPYVCIRDANAQIRKSGLGTIAFDLTGDTRISYLMSWPHVRPWRIARAQPAFRSIPDAARVARLFAEAAETRISEAEVIRVEPATMPSDAIAAE